MSKLYVSEKDYQSMLTLLEKQGTYKNPHAYMAANFVVCPKLYSSMCERIAWRVSGFCKSMRLTVLKWLR